MAGKAKQVPLQDRHLAEFLAIACGGWLLAFNAGMINSATVSDPKSLSVAPMTGASTNIGIGLGEGDFVRFGQNLGIILSHITGAALSGYLVPNRTFYLGSDYGRIFKSGSLVLAAAAITNLLAPNSIFIYLFAAVSTGIQNGLTSRYSGNILRTTHISGSLSDVGLICGRLDKQNLWKLYIHLGIFCSFICGAILTAFSSKHLQHKQLFVNFALYTFIGILYTILIKPEKEYRWFLNLFQNFRTTKIPESDAEGESEPKLDLQGVELSPQTTIEEKIHSERPIAAKGEEEEGLVDAPVLLGTVEPVPSQEVEETLNLSSSDVEESDQKFCEKNETPQSPSPCAPHPAPSDPKPVNPWTYSYTQIGIIALCLHAGFLNATTSHSSRHLFTTHITGAGTQFAIDISNHDRTQIAVRGGMLLCYFLGSVLTGTVVKSDFYSIDKSYVRIFILGTLLLLLALLIHIYFPFSYYFYLILTLFSGMQASLGCKIKGVIIRTTFMSGCATDIGASIGKILRFGLKSGGLSSIKMLLPSLLAYILGAFISTLLYPFFGNYQIIVNIVAFSLIGCLHSYILHYHLESS